MPAQRFEIVLGSTRELLTLEMLAQHAGIHPALIERFVEFGLIEPVESAVSGLSFDASVVPRVLTICRLRDSLGINLAGVAVILDLLDKFCALQRENESLRSRL